MSTSEKPLPPLSISWFNKDLAGLNGLSLSRWVMKPGMEFMSPLKWWDSGRRDIQHNGIDLRLYRDDEGKIHSLHLGTVIPLMYAGRVVRVVRDFLGFSIFALHGEHAGMELLSIYGHVRPLEGLVFAQEIGGGSPIATLNSQQRNSAVPPHCHLSVALIPIGFAYERLEWEYIDNSTEVVILDPLPLIHP